jgi:hypothetical protein
MTYFTTQDLELMKAALEALVSLSPSETDSTRAIKELVKKLNAMIEERKKWGR